MRKLAVSVCLSLLLIGGAKAQPSCPAPASGGVTLTSAMASPELEPARLMLEQAATVTLHPVGEVRFVRAPDKRLDVSTYGGMLAVDVRERATYQVSLSAGAWIDMLKDGEAISSTAHAHGAECSGAAKMVSFVLQPGRHVIQLRGDAERYFLATITLIVSSLLPESCPALLCELRRTPSPTRGEGVMSAVSSSFSPCGRRWRA